MLITPTQEEICLGNEFDTLEEAREKRYFPSNASVYHFHPIAFVEQMKMIVGKYGVRSGYSIKLAVKKLKFNANSYPTSYCGRYVRFALEAGYGLVVDGLKGKTPGAAKDFGSYLVKKKFYKIEFIDLATYKPLKGDIAVFENFQGIKKYHKYGHIQMYDGKNWISDYVQRGFWAGNDFRIKKPNFVIYRW